jgi:2-keto-4-pentenoate hydratase/2-oxohepta-3-ene-1,7-dioic acid hydratase in catechol pathway
MKLVTFSTGTTNQVDVANAGVVRDVSELLPSGAGMLEVIEAWDELWPTLRGRRAADPAAGLGGVARADPHAAAQYLCVGKNYRDHIAEFSRSGYDAPSEELSGKPIVFSKATASVSSVKAAGIRCLGSTSTLSS